MIGILAAVLGMMVALLADVLSSRSGSSRIASYATSLGAGLAATIAAALLVPAESPCASAGIALMAYGAWWFVFLNLVQALESSLRVRLLGEIRAAGGHISVAELEARYNDDILLRLRLRRLVVSGAVKQENDRLRVVSSGLRTIAGLFRVIKKALLGRTSEFGAPST
jgi:hypothetical protein